MFNSRLNQRMNNGYTLIEAIIYLFILVMIITVVISLLISMMSSQERIRTVRDLNRSGVVAMERITRELREATVIISSGENSINFSVRNDDGELISKQFFVSEDNLWLVTAEETRALLADNIKPSSLNFYNQSNNEVILVGVHLGLEHKSDSERQEFFQASVTLR